MKLSDLLERDFEQILACKTASDYVNLRFDAIGSAEYERAVKSNYQFRMASEWLDEFLLGMTHSDPAIFGMRADVVREIAPSKCRELLIMMREIEIQPILG